MITLTPRRSLALLLLIAACLSFIALGKLPLVEPDEGRNAEVAREMLVTHDWVTPHFDGLPYLDKPAALFWAVAASFSVFGLSEWAARLPEALAGIAAVLLAWTLARRMLSERAAFLAGVILATSPLFFGLARTVIFDAPLAALVTASLVCFRLNQEKRGLLLNALAFAAMAAAAITKGPVGFLLPLITLLVYYAVARKFGELKRIHWAIGIVVFLAVALPWFIDVSLRNPGFPKYAFWDESLLRFTTGAHMHRSSGPWYYIPIYFAGFFPWSFFLILAAGVRLKSWRKLLRREHDSDLFLFVWAAVVFVFFTLSSSKLPSYVLPAYPALSIMAARAWQAIWPDARARSAKWLAGGFAAMMAAGIFFGAASAWIHSLPVHAKALRNVPPSVVHLLPASLYHAAIVIAALGFLGWRWMGRGRSGLAFAAAALSTPILALVLAQPLAAYAQAVSSRELATTIERSPERNVPVYGYYYFRTGLPFYLQRPVGLVTEDGDETTSNYITRRFAQFLNAPAEPVSQMPRALPLPTPGPLINGAEFQRLAARESFLLIARNGETAELLSGGRMMPLWSGWKYTVLLVLPSARPDLTRRASLRQIPAGVLAARGLLPAAGQDRD